MSVLNDRAGRQGHLHDAVEQRMVRGVKQGRAAGRVGADEQIRVEPRCGGGRQQGAALEVHDGDGPAGRLLVAAADRPPLQGGVEQFLGRPLQPGIQRQHQVAAGGRLLLVKGRRRRPL